ncbi:MAG TPA: GNAT family N-acetyltransferase [Pyrinomonadaceae bacterium]
MSTHTAILIEPTEELWPEFFAMAEEYSLSGDTRYRLALEDFPEFLRELSDDARGIGLPPARVPCSTFWLTAGRHPIGSSRIRHHLTPDLEDEGGHVGYDIRPSERRKGYGVLILELTLAEARKLGLSRVLLTCDTDNAGSARVIERNGGRLQSQGVSKRSGKPISRYWIEL